MAFFLKNLKAEVSSYSISKPEVFKRNKASCNRLGNIYDACQWMTKFIVKNRGKNNINNLCIFMKVNAKVYELCYGETKKINIRPNAKQTFLINLTKSINISNDSDKPLVRIIKRN